METKLKIQSGGLLIEAEGQQDFVKEIYEYAKTILEQQTKPPKKSNAAIGDRNKKHSPENKPKASSSNKTKHELKTLDNLDLYGKKGNESILDFTAKYFPKNHKQWFIILLYYFQEVRKLDKIGLNHIYTAYKAINKKHSSLKKPPKSMRDNLYNCNRNSTLIEITSVDDFRLNEHGINFAENDIQENAMS
jgi:hypothetical protein